jgi:hypothetical protein
VDLILPIGQRSEGAHEAGVLNLSLSPAISSAGKLPTRLLICSAPQAKAARSTCLEGEVV